MSAGMRDDDRTGAIVWATVALVSLAPWVALAVLAPWVALAVLSWAVVLVAAAGLLS